MSKINLYLGDCMEAMKGMEDNQYDLAIVDPPYGIGEGNKKNLTRHSNAFGKANNWAKSKDYGGAEFDYSIPDKSYFDQIFRITKNQIIWGGNYMVNYLKPSMGWVVWDKDNGDCDQSDCELAYTSFKKGLRKFKFRWQGLLQQNMKNKETKIHPTQKPVKLYEWLLHNYAKEGDKILDTHGGSMSIALACHNLDFDLDLWEIDEDYFEAGKNRLEKHRRQLKLF